VVGNLTPKINALIRLVEALQSQFALTFSVQLVRPWQFGKVSRGKNGGCAVL
jgi:hypothetical protein